MTSLRNYGPGAPATSTGNEAKNERLRLRWLGGAVAELQTELAEVLRTRNASEELAERARLRSEISLLRGDVAGVDRAVRDLGGRLARLEAGLGTLRLDVAAVNERFGLLSRTCADVGSQVIMISAPRPHTYTPRRRRRRGCSAHHRPTRRAVNARRWPRDIAGVVGSKYTVRLLYGFAFHEDFFFTFPYFTTGRADDFTYA
jgi:hypothetical protein